MVALLAAFSNSLSAQHKLEDGTWRGALKTASGVEVPFNFQVDNVKGKLELAIINGAEHLKVTDVTTKGDSVFINMPLFDSEFRLKHEKGKLNGLFIRHLGTKDSSIPFSATSHTAWRFASSATTAKYNIDGRWSAVFGQGDGRDTTVGEFKQKDDYLTGTFLTTTGDYRYLEGVVSGDKLYLSCFDGGHVFLFMADINDENHIINGKWYSGLAGQEDWVATKDANAKLPDAYKLTGLKAGESKLAFTFPDLTGKKVSLTDDRFKNKVVIVEIMGSWCPNCMDETGYLVPFYNKYHGKGVEVIGLAYERTTDFTKSKASLTREKDHFNIPYPLLVTGYTPAKGDPAKSLPMMDKFMGFPTTFIIDKKGNVRKTYTGFSGPGTGDYYTQFTSGFEKIVDNLLAE